VRRAAERSRSSSGRCVRQQISTAAPATDDPMLRAALETFRRPDPILEVE
jgi:hypothetical protein